MKLKPSNLPPAILAMLSNPRRPTPGRYGVNSLIGPPRIEQLRRRHWDEIEVEPENQLWMLFGTLLHGNLEKHSETGNAEERMVHNVDGTDVSMVIDDTIDGYITDYKFCSVWSTKDGVKDEYVKQLNVYRYFKEKSGVPIKGLRLIAIYRDWQQSKSKESDYPPRVQVFDVPMWDMQTAEEYIKSRVRFHRSCEGTADALLPHCTDEERWASPLVYAVMKKGRKAAIKLFKVDGLMFQTEEEAKKAAEERAVEEKGYVEERPREYRRCETCDVRQFCNQFAG